MGFETPPLSGNSEEKKPDEEQQVANTPDREKDNEKEESVGRHVEQYKGSDGVSHSTSPLPPETIEKLEKLKKKQNDDEDNPDGLKEAA